MNINIKEKTACKLDNYTNVTITGKDAQKFLQGQLSCDLNDITSSQPGIGCYCNIKGRILAYFDIFNIDSSYIINLP
ncbi:hypothetical protein OAO18_05860, partial [Francisellaceae bacterium]|nr:hypothetical protein [Francisellaceae bacterium]